MTMSNSKKNPTWLLERVAQGELAAAEVEQLRQRLAAEGRSMDDELGALQASSRHILAELPRQTVGDAIRRRAASTSPSLKTPRSRLALLFAPTLLAGSVAFALFMTRGPGNPAKAVSRPPADEDDIILKGDILRSPRLVVYRRKAAQASGLPGSEKLSDGAPAARGDVLQLAYDKAPDGLFGVLLSIDGAGRVTQHLPEEGARAAAPLTPVREIPLPSAYELDDAPDFERFVLVTSAQPFAIEVALDAARAVSREAASAKTASLTLAPNYRQTSILVHKTGKGTP